MSNTRGNARNQQIGDFVLNNDAIFPWMCYPWVPSPEACGKKKMRFEVEFKHVTPERRLEILEEFREKMRQREALQGKSEAELSDDDIEMLRDVLSFERMLLEEVVVRFTKYVMDQHKNDISAHPETKPNMLRNSWARDSLLKSYQIALESRAPEGN